MELTQIAERQRELASLLLQKRNEGGFWQGRLSSSALGTAVALTALHFYDKTGNQASIIKGTDWLISNQNADGGYGDSPESAGNISTSLLVYSAFNILERTDINFQLARDRLSSYLFASDINVNSSSVADAILKHYKKDYTFSVPILTMCALCCVPSVNGFKKIPQLPFELALLPRKFYSLLNLNVVSYAIPALIAVGIAIFNFKPAGNFLVKRLREKAILTSLDLLRNLMPGSGGFLEAIPLTGFVNICLITSGYRDLDVVNRGSEFLKNTQREDGSWAIDIDLSTWVTTLSVKALKRPGENNLNDSDSSQITGHLLNLQYSNVHPFNGSKPGGWGWTNHSGSVPDGDDTPGAIIALLLLNPTQLPVIRTAVIAGCNWLLGLQNNDGGFPTFVKGWGKLPFDKSCADLTGHCILALALTLESFPDIANAFQKKYLRSIKNGINYLDDNQKDDGSFLPLWFGNQLTAGHLNPVYGTARVISYISDMADFHAVPESIRINVLRIIAKGQDYLRKSQNRDGSWGGDRDIQGTIEETALGLGALVGPDSFDACMAAVTWLDNEYNGGNLKSSPIGLYFASLWYDEELYPHTAYLEGLTRYLEKTLSPAPAQCKDC